jgi:hypothetical protein
MVIQSVCDREKPAADTITTNGQAEAVSQNAVEANPRISREGREIGEEEEERILVFPIPNAQNKDNDEPS